MTTSLSKIIDRVLREQKIDLLSSKEFNSAMTAVIGEMLLTAPKRTAALSSRLQSNGDDVKTDIVTIVDTANKLADEVQGLKLALEVATARLSFMEPNDSRAVSDVFVSLASVVSGHTNDACWRILREEKARLETIDFEAARDQNDDTVSIRIGRGDGYPLPPELLENKTVGTIIDFLRETPESALRFLSKPFFARHVVPDAMDAELELALTALTDKNLAVLAPVWMFLDPISGEEYELTAEDRQTIIDENLFIHPETGNPVTDFRNHIGHYWALNTDNGEFLAWKAQVNPGLKV